MLLTPPHVEEFLSGERRALLGGLDPDRSGCVCEVLTPDEWDALTLVSKRGGTKRWLALEADLVLVYFVRVASKSGGVGREAGGALRLS